MAQNNVNEYIDFSFEKKKKLASRIQKACNGNKIITKKIKEIIFHENPEIEHQKTNQGYLMYFQNLTNSTYHKIDKFLNKLDLEKQRRVSLLNNSSTNVDQYGSTSITLSSDDPDNYDVTRTRLRYSNCERKIIKKREYDSSNNINNESSNENHNVCEKTNNGSKDKNNDVVKLKKKETNENKDIKDIKDIKESLGSHEQKTIFSKKK